MHRISIPLVVVVSVLAGAAAQEPLLPPMLLEREALEAGNPLATYAKMLALESRYLASEPLREVYREVRCNFEQFLGFPMAGPEAMNLSSFRSVAVRDADPFPEGFEPRDAVDLIAERAAKTRIVIWAEEHHLPQTRSLYEAVLRTLHQQGYRYLAAEAFGDGVAAEDFRVPLQTSGYYLRDPVYANAVRTARRLGYTLVPYDTSERGEPGDVGFRDRTQAANIRVRTLDRDPEAKVLVIAGRLHASEIAAPDGWTPMAAVLKKSTGIDPLTLYAPTMSARLDPAQEDPLYRTADARGLVGQPVVFVGPEGRLLGFASCDAYVFWPRPKLVHGRPDWMIRELARKPFAVPEANRAGSGLRLVQVFEPSDPDRAVPVDQIVLGGTAPEASLMLPPGSFRVRTIDPGSKVLATTTVEVR